MLNTQTKWEPAIRKLYMLAACNSEQAHEIARRLLQKCEEEEAAGEMTRDELDSIAVSLAAL